MKIHKNLKLSPSLFESVKDKNKTLTIRLGLRDIENHSSFKLIRSDNESIFINAKIKKIRHCKLSQITYDELLLAGKNLTPVDYMINQLKPFYPNIELNDNVTVIEFTLL